MNHKLAPHSIEAEESVLGSVLINPDMYPRLATIIGKDDFFILRHGIIWEAFNTLMEKQVEIDNVTVANHLQSIPDGKGTRLDSVGGHSYLTHLLSSTPTSLHAVSYATVVKQLAGRRGLLNVATQIANLANDYEQHPESIGTQSLQLLQDTIQPTVKRAFSMQEVLLELQDDDDTLESLDNAGILPRDALRGYSTGLRDLDVILDGLKPDCLYVVAAPTGFGKTSFGAIHTAIDVAQQPIHPLIGSNRVVVVSNEMSEKRLVNRMISYLMKMDSKKVAKRDFTDGEHNLYIQMVGKLAMLPIHIIEARGLTFTQIQWELAALRARVGNFGLIVIDYLQEMESEQIMAQRGESSDNRATELARSMRRAKTLSSPNGRNIYAFGCPVMLVVQYNRKGQFEGSSGIEKSSDCTIELEADENVPTRAIIKVTKHRDGNTHSNGIGAFYRKECYFWGNLQMPYEHIPAKQYKAPSY